MVTQCRVGAYSANGSTPLVAGIRDAVVGRMASMGRSQV